jgi:HK97 gp10 family phage protein
MGVEAEFQACAKNLNDSIKREMARKGAMATNTLRNVELEVLSKGGSGKKYKRLPNRSSAPGETPAPQSGNLRQDWNDETLIEGNRVTSRLKSNVKYARWLEDGTKKMAKRPFVNPIKKKAEPEVVKIFGSDFEVTL